MSTEVTPAKVGEHDQAILDELGIEYAPMELYPLDLIEWSRSQKVQSRSERLNNERVTTYAEVETLDLPAVVLFIDNHGDTITLGLHRSNSRRKRRGETHVKAIRITDARYEGLDAEDYRILALATRLNAKHGARENNNEFILETAAHLHLKGGLTVREVSEQFSLPVHVVQTRVNRIIVHEKAVAAGADLSLPELALKEIVRLKDKDLIQLACTIPVAGSGEAPGTTFPYIVKEVLKVKGGKAAQRMRLDQFVVEYRGKHEDIRTGVVPVAGEGKGLDSVVSSLGAPRADSKAALVIESRRKAGRQLAKLTDPGRVLIGIDISNIIKAQREGATPKQIQDTDVMVERIEDWCRDYFRAKAKAHVAA